MEAKNFTSNIYKENTIFLKTSMLDKITCKTFWKSALLKCCIFVIWKVMKCTYLG